MEDLTNEKLISMLKDLHLMDDLLVDMQSVSQEKPG